MTDSVAQRTEAASALIAAEDVGRDLMGGTKAMRAAGERRLPKFDAESVKGYEARLKSSWLFNGYKKTVKDMTGRVFAKSIEVADGAVDEGIEANIDGQGNDLSAFARNVFEDGLGGAGIAFVMVDAPRREGDVTMAQAQAMNLRPYLVHIPLEDVLGWKTALIGSQTVLTQWRMFETATEQDPDDEFNEIAIRQVRVLTLADGGVNCRIYRQAAQTQKWTLFDEFDTDADEITVAAFYANRTGFFQAEPPLQDLADVNVAHWQSQSDQRNILHFARVPILTASGYDDEDGERPLVLSAGRANVSRDPEFNMQWVEHSGQAIGAGRDDLKDLEFQMQALGLQLLVAGQETATGAVLDAAKETAPLAMMADNLKDTMERALKWVAMYQGRDEQITVTVNKDYGVVRMTAQDVTALMTAVNMKLVSRRFALRVMAERWSLPEDTDIDLVLSEAEDNDDELMADGVS